MPDDDGKKREDDNDSKKELDESGRRIELWREPVMEVQDVTDRKKEEESILGEETKKITRQT